MLGGIAAALLIVTLLIIAASERADSIICPRSERAPDSDGE
ncbi:hypothetical protein [Paenibacillus sp. SYP-B4298]|nr:hypothetical protein [Paenibacillus sp. SYP-B4298]